MKAPTYRTRVLTYAALTVIGDALLLAGSWAGFGAVLVAALALLVDERPGNNQERKPPDDEGAPDIN